jgi:hypothetical protein
MRLIDKDELIDFIKSNGYVYANTLEDFPDPVVRCGMCKFYEQYEDWDRDREESYICHQCTIYDMDLGECGFCSRGITR